MMTEYQSTSKTDRNVLSPILDFSYSGRAADVIGYVESAQLLDPDLWALFVDQFRRGDADDCDCGWRCEYWGKMMRGAVMTYQCTRNETLYAILTDTVCDLLTTADPMGRISTYTVEKEFSGWDVWGRKYVMLGLLYYLEICRDRTLARTVTAALCRHADYITEKLGDPGEGKTPITLTSDIWDGLNSSSILEPFVKLYALTGERRYLAFAETIIHAGGMHSFNLFEAALADELYPCQYPVTKAYEMISCFEGIIEYYRVTGEEKYKTMALNFARRVMASDITVIGCAGTTHELFDHSAVTQFDPKYNGIMQETCVTVTWMKFCYSLLCLTGDPVWGDQLERSVYNALTGSVNVNRHECRGQVFTFDSYSPLLNGWRGREVGGRKDIIPEKMNWGCCVAIGAAGTALVGQTAVMQSREGGSVNLYLPGESRFVLSDGVGVTLRCETDYPVGGKVRIVVVPDREANFVLSLRIPQWSSTTLLTVNGESVSAAAGTYARVERTWCAGDEAELAFDMGVKIIRAADIDPTASADCICHAALRRGPVMLARDSSFGEDVTAAVTLTDEGGYAVAEPVSVNIPAEQAYRISTAEGYITVADYASCGHREWSESAPMTVWITTCE